jgi:rubrerythrin
MTEKILAAQALSERTRKNLLEAMRGEAFAFAKYKLFARQARKHGHHDLAALFDKAADQKYMEHFTGLADLLELAGTDEQDVTAAIASESFEVDTFYKHFADTAREDGDDRVARRFEEIRRDEAYHQLAFQEALIKLQTRDRLMKGAPRRNSRAREDSVLPAGD